MLKTSLLQGRNPLGIAVSGGSDSTALLVLCARAVGAENLRAVSVNHSLRKAAVDEISRVSELCAALGVRHDSLSLTLSDGSDLQARARAARYDALASWALENHVSAIAVGHSKDDVAETFLMRLARGSGVDGLAQMPEVFERSGAVFLRPVMEASRVELRAVLQSQNIMWSEDPSNDDPRFTRVQMRQAQADLDDLGLTADRLSQTARWMRAASEVLEQAADTWIAAHAFADHGDAVFDRDALRDAPEETAARVLSRTLCAISGHVYRPRFSALSEIMVSEVATTLHGCLIYPNKGTLRVTRELHAINDVEEYWTIKGPLEETHSVAPLGEVGLSQMENWRETALLPRRSLLSSPAIWDETKVIAAPLAAPDDIWSAMPRDPFKPRR